MKFIINGSFLVEPMMGVQRYAFEIVNELDKISEGLDIGIVVPELELVTPIPDYKNIKVERFGTSTGKKFEQFELPRFLKNNKAFGIHLCNAVPIIYPKGIVCVHDIAFTIHPEFFTEKGDWHEILFRKMLYKRAFKRANKILTVSKTSKKEILQYYGRKCKLKKSDIVVTPNGWQHFNSDGVDESIFETFSDIKRGEYYYYMASLAKNKNISWILENAKRFPENQYVLTGRPLGDKLDLTEYKNVIYTGFVTDEQAKALMKNCKAFIFPSLYEGFGIPPMEALCMGAKIILSDIPILKEVYGDTGYYIDPFDSNVDLNELIKGEVASASETLDKYSWRKSAARLKEAIESCR